MNMAFSPSSCTRCARSLLRPQLPRSIQTHFSIHRLLARQFSTSPLRPAATPPSASETKTHTAPIIPPSSSSPSIPPSILKNLQKSASSSTETYAAYGATEVLYKQCALQAAYTIPPPSSSPSSSSTTATPSKTSDGIDLGVGTTWWHTHLGLTPTFNTWSQITMLHLYLLSTRLRLFPADHAPTWQQHLLDHFFYDAEDKMVVNHGMAARGVRNRYLKDLFVQYRGSLAAYDEGLCKGDAVLATALWRNIWGGRELDDDKGEGKGGVDLSGLAEVVAYTRREVQYLEGLSDGQVAAGDVKFGKERRGGDHGELKRVVGKKSALTDEPFRDEDFEGGTPS